MNPLSSTLSKANIKTILLDILALLVITFVPAISHVLSVPLYLVEPMRILAVISVIHTSKKNSYFIAFMLPLFSFLLSSHPSIFKTLLICSELTLNIWLFYFLVKKLDIIFLSMFISIIISKVFYYTFKLGLLNINLIDGDLLATPIYLQFLVAFVLSIYTHFIFKRVK